MWPAERVYSLIMLALFSGMTYLFAVVLPPAPLALPWAAVVVCVIYGIGAAFFLIAVLFDDFVWRLVDRLL